MISHRKKGSRKQRYSGAEEHRKHMLILQAQESLNEIYSRARKFGLSYCMAKLQLLHNDLAALRDQDEHTKRMLHKLATTYYDGTGESI